MGLPLATMGITNAVVQKIEDDYLKANPGPGPLSGEKLETQEKHIDVVIKTLYTVAGEFSEIPNITLFPIGNWAYIFAVSRIAMLENGDFR